MLKKYNISAELLVLASAYYNKGQKKDAAKLALLAMAEEDSKDLFEDLDNTNQDLDPTNVEVVEDEVISDADLEDALIEMEAPAEAPAEEEVEEVEDTEEVEAEGEDDSCEECKEELPEVEEVLSKVRARKEILANLASLSGKTEARREAIKKFLSK